MRFPEVPPQREEQADVTGAQMLAKAGYDPMDMVTFFETLRTKNARDPSKVEQFFSSHPAPTNRAARVTREVKMLKTSPTQVVGGFRQVKAELRKMPGPTTPRWARTTRTSAGCPRRRWARC